MLTTIRAMLRDDLDRAARRAAELQGFVAGVAAGLAPAADEAAVLWGLLHDGDPAAPLDPDLLADQAIAALHDAVDDTTLADPAEYRRRLLRAAALILLAAAALILLAAAALAPEIHGGTAR